MKFADPRLYADPEKAARRILEIASDACLPEALNERAARLLSQIG